MMNAKQGKINIVLFKSFTIHAVQHNSVAKRYLVLSQCYLGRAKLMTTLNHGRKFTRHLVQLSANEGKLCDRILRSDCLVFAYNLSM